MQKKIWFDITNTPHVHFLLAIRYALGDENFSYIFSSRDFSETNKLLSTSIKENYINIGSHYGKNFLKKIFGLFLRFRNIYNLKLDYDISVSCGSESAIWKSKLDNANKDNTF